MSHWRVSNPPRTRGSSETHLPCFGGVWKEGRCPQYTCWVQSMHSFLVGLEFCSQSCPGVCQVFSGHTFHWFSQAILWCFWNRYQGRHLLVSVLLVSVVSIASYINLSVNVGLNLLCALVSVVLKLLVWVFGLNFSLRGLEVWIFVWVGPVTSGLSILKEVFGGLNVWIFGLNWSAYKGNCCLFVGVHVAFYRCRTQHVTQS